MNRSAGGRVPRSGVGLVLSGGVLAVALGCASSSGPAATLPDAAVLAAAARARSEFEARHPALADEDLTAGVREIGRRALAASPRLAGSGSGRELASGWRFVVLDRAAPEVFLFADRSLYLSRGALAGLPGEWALEELARRAAEEFASGGFRSGDGKSLVEQPLRVPLGPAAPAPEASLAGGAAPSEARDRWLDLLDGLPFGEPPERGVADGPDLLFPVADLRLSLPAGDRFELAGPGEFTATRAGERLGLRVRERRVAAGWKEAGNGGDLAAERRTQQELATRIAALAGERGLESALAEAFRARGVSGVRARLHAAAERSGGPGRASDPVPASLPVGLTALLDAPGALVEVGIECDGPEFARCEARFLEVLNSAGRLLDAPLPGPLRLAARPVGEGGSARSVLTGLVEDGESPVSLRILLALNRGWLDEELSQGDRVLVVSSGSGTAAGESRR